MSSSQNDESSDPVLNSRPNYRSGHAGAIVLSIGLLLLFIATSAPVYVYYIVPWGNYGINASELATASCGSQSTTEAVSVKLLAESACSSVFPRWSQSETELNGTSRAESTRNISVSGCGSYSRGEGDLQTLLKLAKELSIGTSCIQKITPLFCFYAFKDCNNFTRSAEPSTSYEICAALANPECETLRGLWSNLETYNNYNPSCLTVPKCGNLSRIFLVMTNDSKPMDCQEPLVPSKSKLANGFCSPPCDSKEWKTTISSTSFYSTLYVSIAFCWICLITTLITYVKVKELFSYHCASRFFFAFSLSLFMAAITIPVFAGQNKVYCKHKDLLSSWQDSTTLCHVQGSIGHFGYVSSLIWWLSSVYNILVAVWKTTNGSEQNKKARFFLQLVLSIIIPGGLVAASFVLGQGYTNTTVFSVTCSPSTLFATFYTLILPSSLITFIGTVMSTFVIYRLFIAKKFQRLSLGAQTNSSAYKSYSTIQRRFFLLSFLMPLAFSSIMISTIVYGRSYLKYVRDFVRNIACSNNPNPATASHCKNELVTTDAAVVSLVDIILFDVFVFAVSLYCLLPKPARAYWLQVWRKFCNVTQGACSTATRVNRGKPLELTVE